MRDSTRTIQKYLARQAEPEAALRSAIPGLYGHAIAVPLLAEGDAFFDLLRSIQAGPLGPALVIAVLNAREDAPEHVFETNARLEERLCDELQSAGALAPGLRMFHAAFGALLLVDRSRAHPFPCNQGVGLARKIACDLALALFADGKLASPWLHCTDADARLPADYLHRPPEGNAVAAIYPHAHDPGEPDPHRSPANSGVARRTSPVELRRAAALYESFLRCYVVGLQRAGSPYAYHSIGSTLAVAAGAYAEVRGVPRRQGAEDFYLLDKLAKLGVVERLGGPPIRLLARTSERVPFGTGRAMLRILASPALTFSFTNPAAYGYLAALLRTFRACCATPDTGKPRTLLLRSGAGLGLDPDVLSGLAEHLDLANIIDRSLSRATTPAVRLRDLHTYFDARRTLKLIHWLRDHSLPDVSWEQAVMGLGLGAAGSPEAALERLVAAEQHECTGPAGVPMLTGADCFHDALGSM